MKLYIDGDGCNARARAFVLRLVSAGVFVELVSNVAIRVPNEVAICPHYRAVVVKKEEGAVDSYVLGCIEQGDALITRDLRFAKGALTKGAWVASDYGEQYDAQTIDARIISAQARMDVRFCVLEYGGISRLPRKAKRAHHARLQALDLFIHAWLRRGA